MRWKLEYNTTGRNYQDQKQKLQKRHYSGCNTAVWNDNKCNKGGSRGYLTHRKDTTVNPVRKQSHISITA